MIKLSDFMYQVGWFRLKEKEYEKVYLFYGLEVHFCGTYAQVTGKIPYILAKEIYMWDPEFVYEIYPGGGYESKPEASATSTEFEEFSQRWVDEWKRKKVSTDEFQEALHKKKNELLKENSESMYIELYDIKTPRGLKTFLEIATEFFKKNSN